MQMVSTSGSRERSISSQDAFDLTKNVFHDDKCITNSSPRGKPFSTGPAAVLIVV